MPEVDATMLIHPGKILKEEFLAPRGVSPSGLAAAIGIPRGRIAAIINGECGMCGEVAGLLARVFGTTAEFRLNLQARYELEMAGEWDRGAA